MKNLSDSLEEAEGKAKITLYDVVMPADHFQMIDLPEREAILHPWLKTESISMISGWRGIGKTFFALGIADAVTKGGGFGPWKCEKPVHCLYLDAEMPASEVKDRIINMRLDSDREKRLFIYSDGFASRKGLSRAHLSDKMWRTRIFELMQSWDVELWILDNLASLSSGRDENSTLDWSDINRWLLELRFAGISTILIHHVGKGGDQRGASSREDNLDISIMLKKPHDYATEDGARLVAHFSKHRVRTKELALLRDTEFQLINKDGFSIWTYKDIEKNKREEVLKMIDQGASSKDIQAALDISKGYVSRIKSDAMKSGYLTKKGKLTQSGHAHIY